MVQMQGGTDDLRPIRRWTREEFERLIEAGILGEDERLEFIDGEILVMPPQGTRHSALTPSAAEALRTAFGAGFHIREHSPIALGADSRPEPDVAVVRGSPKDYLERLPGPADILLLLEVADSSRPFDLGRKAQLYARASIHDHWVSDADDGCIVVYRNPGADGYGTITRHRAGEQVSPLQAGAPVPASALVA